MPGVLDFVGRPLDWNSCRGVCFWSDGPGVQTTALQKTPLHSETKTKGRLQTKWRRSNDRSLFLGRLSKSSFDRFTMSRCQVHLGMLTTLPLHGDARLPWSSTSSFSSKFDRFWSSSSSCFVFIGQNRPSRACIGEPHPEATDTPCSSVQCHPNWLSTG